MSDTVTLKASLREHTGTRSAVKLREQGLMPAVIYGHKQEPVSISLNAHEFVEKLHHGHRIFEVDIDGSGFTILVKEMQYDYLGKDAIHADLMRVNLSERVTVDVMLKVRGTAAGVLEGGIIEEVMNSVQIECEVRNIPESLAVNVKDLGLNESLHAGQIELPAGMTLITDPEAVIVSCRESKAALAEEGTEGVEGAGESAEPEVITERKEEEKA